MAKGRNVSGDECKGDIAPAVIQQRYTRGFCDGRSKMRLSLKVNGIRRLVAAVNGSGYLNAHLNLSERPNVNENSKLVRIVGIETHESETVRLSWPEMKLQIGDTVELEVLSDGESDPPAESRKSSESPNNLLSQPEFAREVVSVVSTFDAQLMRLLKKSKETEPEHEHKKFALAVGYVLAQLGDSLLYPIYRRHKELMPDEVKGDFL